MRRLRLLLVIGIATLVGLAAWRWQTLPESPPSAPSAGDTSQIDVAANHAAPTASGPPADSTEPASADAPAVRDYLGYKSFERRIRDFLERSRSMNLAERIQAADGLRSEIDEHERSGRLLPTEAYLLRIALVRDTATSEAAFQTEAAALVAQFDAQAKAREAAAQSRVDPAFEAYKTREAEITREVMQLPAGPERDELLRKRLEAARVEAYAPAGSRSE